MARVMVKGESTIIFSVALTKRAVMTLRQGVHPYNRIQLLSIMASGSVVIPVFWSEYSKGVPFFFM